MRFRLWCSPALTACCMFAVVVLVSCSSTTDTGGARTAATGTAADSAAQAAASLDQEPTSEPAAAEAVETDPAPAAEAAESANPEPAEAQSEAAPPMPAESVVAELLDVTVLRRSAHDSNAFTQGLEFADGRMFESTGSPSAFYPNSTTSIREVDPATGDVLRERDFGQDYFGEGLTLVGDSLVQLSWRSGKAYVFDRESFEIIGEFEYGTEGWGLCHDGERFVMSDGTGNLYFRNTDTFELESQVEVLRNGIPVVRLNELECVDGSVWSNIWYGNEILRIDPVNGAVTGVADLGGIAAEFAAVHSEHVLNGIAFDDSTDTFTITGKRWSAMFEVEFSSPE